MKVFCLILCLAEASFLKEFFFCLVNSRLLGLKVYLVKPRAWPEAMRLAINFNFLLKLDLRYVFTLAKIKLEFFHCVASKNDVIGCALGITVDFELVFEQTTGDKFSKLEPNVCFSCCDISSTLGCPFCFFWRIIFNLLLDWVRHRGFTDNRGAGSWVDQGSKVLVSFRNYIGKYTNGNFWYVVLFGDDLLIVVVGVALFFQGQDFIIGLRMVGCVLAVVIRSFLLLVVFFPLLLRACWITVVALLVASIVSVVW